MVNKDENISKRRRIRFDDGPSSEQLGEEMTQDEVVIDPNAQHHDEQPEIEPTQPMELMDPNLHEKDHDIQHQPHDTEIEHDGIMELVQRYNEQPTMKDGRSEKNESWPGEQHIGAPVLPSREVEEEFAAAKLQATQSPEEVTAKQKKKELVKPKPKRTRTRVTTGDDTVFDNADETRTIGPDEKGKRSAERVKPDENKIQAGKKQRKQLKKARMKANAGDNTVFDNPETRTVEAEEREKRSAERVKPGDDKIPVDVEMGHATKKGDGTKRQTKALTVGSAMLQGSPDDEQRNAMTTKKQQQSDGMSPESTQLGEPYYKTIMDILSIMCLLPLMNDYWEFPVQVARNGGYAFIFLYVIIIAVLVYPTLCFVLFVSQFTQTGLVDVFGMYGRAYRGFGYGYLVLIIISHMSILHDSSILLKHLRVSLDDNPSMFACMQPYVQDWSNCTSVFLDSSCMAAKSRQDFYARGLCWQQPPSEFAESSVNSYIKYLTERTDGQTVDLEMTIWYVVQLAVLGGVALVDPLVLVPFLSILMVLFFILSITNAISSVNGQAFNTLHLISDFKRLGTIEPWISAIRLAFSSSGLGKVAIFCMSSFRNTHGRHFTTATFVIVGKLIVCFLGLLSFFSNFTILYTLDKRHKTSFSPENKGLIYLPAFVADVYSFYNDFPDGIFDNAEFVLVYNSVTSLAAIFTVAAIARKQKAERSVKKARFAIIYVLACFVYAITNCVNFLGAKHNFFILTCSLHMYIAATITILSFSHGVQGWRKNVREMFPMSRYPFYFKYVECGHTVIPLIVIAVLLVSQIYELVMLCTVESRIISELVNNKKTWELSQELIAVVIAVVPIILPLAFALPTFLSKKVKPSKGPEKPLTYKTNVTTKRQEKRRPMERVREPRTVVGKTTKLPSAGEKKPSEGKKIRKSPAPKTKR